MLHFGKITLLVAALAAGSASAQSFPGRIEQGVVGDWVCGETRLYITRLGSIEVLGNGYRAGLYDAADSTFAIKWDEGGREDWTYTVTDGGLSMTTPDPATSYSCEPRKR